MKPSDKSLYYLPLCWIISPEQQLKVVLELVKTAILIPMYPARIEVAAPMRKAVAVYGKFVLGSLRSDLVVPLTGSSLVISYASTVHPRITANTAAKILRYRYS